MLLTSLNSSSETVFVDLLTYGDLEALRAKKLGKVLNIYIYIKNMHPINNHWSNVK
jgi:hypothetical protein